VAKEIEHTMSFLIDAYRGWSAEEAAQHCKVYFEVWLSENSLVLHEILFSDRDRWPIEASDILWEWKPWK
jgi:hypothetical protein